MKKINIFLIAIIVLFCNLSALMAQVAINSDGTSPNASAMLDVKSTTKGLLIPRMTTGQRNSIASPATGLLVYDQSLNLVYMNTGTPASPNWTSISTGSLWTRSGSYTYLSNTTDKVGIGTTTPGYMSGATTYLTVSNTVYGNQISSLELKGSSGTTYNPVSRLDFLSHSSTNTVYNIARIEATITNAQFEGELLFYTNGGTLSERMRIDEDGKVGIGTSNPSRTFEVFSGTDWHTARISADYHGSFIEFVGTSSPDWAVGAYLGSTRLLSSTDNFSTTTDEYWFTENEFRTYNNNDKTLGTSAYRWSGIYSINGDFSGDVGIGTTTPDRKLEVYSDWKTARLSSNYAGAFLEFVGTHATDWAIGGWDGSLQISSSTDNFANYTTQFFFNSLYFNPFINNSKSLGSTTYRWSTINSYDGDFADDVTIADAINLGGKLFLGDDTELGILINGLEIFNDNQSNSIVYITPDAISSGDSATIFLAEDDDAYYGMYWMYDGVGNHMELWGKDGALDYGPHIAVTRNSGDVAIGGTFLSGYKLSVDGNIICEKVRVMDSGSWADYVFDDDYELLSLAELARFIEINNHLPNVPAAAEIEKEGLDLGQSQKMMMEKIEELTLYILQQQEQIDELKEQIKKLNNNE